MSKCLWSFSNQEEEEEEKESEWKYSVVFWRSKKPPGGANSSAGSLWKQFKAEGPGAPPPGGAARYCLPMNTARCLQSVDPAPHQGDGKTKNTESFGRHDGKASCFTRMRRPASRHWIVQILGSESAEVGDGWILVKSISTAAIGRGWGCGHLCPNNTLLWMAGIKMQKFNCL